MYRKNKTETTCRCYHLQYVMKLLILKQHNSTHSFSGITYKYLPVCFSISLFWSAACTSPFVWSCSTVCTRISIFSSASSLSASVNRVSHVTPDNWNGINYFIWYSLVEAESLYLQTNLQKCDFNYVALSLALDSANHKWTIQRTRSDTQLISRVGSMFNQYRS